MSEALDFADKGDTILIRRKRKELYALVRVGEAEDDDWEMTPELRKRIEVARRDYRAGKYYEMSPDENLDSFLDRLEVGGHYGDN